MRFIKPLLAGAALLAVALPTLASADPAYGGRGGDYHRDGGYQGDRGGGDYGRGDFGGRDDGDRGNFSRSYGYRDGGEREHEHDRWRRWNFWRWDHHADHYRGW